MAKKKHKSRGKDGAIALKDIDMFFVVNDIKNKISKYQLAK